MATVYAVVDPDTGERFAIKLLTQPGASIPRLLQEYRALARIDHPNIVRVYRFGTNEEGLPYVVMELLDGVPAQVRVKATGRPGEPMRTAEAVRIAREVAIALGHLHARGIVHRDLKSSNVLVLPDGGTRLLDFGTARLVDAYDPITQLGEFVGTFAYASPEQISGGAVDARSDLYSLGVLLFRMLCGRRPFEGENPHDLARSHLDAAPPDPAVLVPGLPRPLADLVLRLLAKLPADRPLDGRSVADALAPFAADSAVAGVGHAPILGRDRAFAEAQRFLSEASPGSALFGVGDEGSGRRTFVELVAEEAARRGARVLPLAGDDDAFRRLVWSVRDLRTDDEELPIDDPATASPLPETIRAVASLLAARADAANRVTVLAAPAWWAISGAAQDALFAVLDAVAERGAPVVLVGAGTAGAGLRARCRAVALRPLSGAETAAVAAHALGVSGIPPELARRLLRASGGMPGPLTELVRALSGAHAHTPLVIPMTLRDAAIARLETLGRVERRLVEAIALSDRGLDQMRLAWLVDEPESLVAPALLGMRRAGVAEVAGAFWHLRDGILAELVRGRMRPVRRQLFARRHAAIADDLPPSEALADACFLAGRHREAAEIAVRWAWPLVRAGNWSEALPLLERVANVNPELDAALGVRFWTLYGECLAETESAPGRAAYAIGRASAMVQDASDAAEVELAASRLARARSDSLAERALLQTALARLDDGSAQAEGRAAEGRAHLADLHVRSGDLLAAVSEAGLALRSGGNDLVRFATTLGYTQLAAGRIADAELTFRGAEARARAEGRNDWRGVAGLVVVLCAQGRFSEATEIGELAERSGRAGAPGHRLAALQLALAEGDISLWCHGTARRRLDQALDALRGEVPPRLEARVALLRGRLAWDAGDPEAAIDLVELALQSPGVEAARGGAAEVRGARGVFLCGAGRADVGWIDLAAAVTALVEMGGLPALARLGELAGFVIDDPALIEPIWSPLQEWLTAEPARPARLSRALNRLRFVRQRGWDDTEERLTVRVAWDDLAAQLVATDASALHVHPWAKLAAGR
jgi:tetratricopeptide (TPR) repeat protein